MFQSVKDAFPKFTTKLEGRKSWMYVDVKGLVTTGTGNLVDPVAAAVKLPFQHANGSPATAAEITAAWNDLKTNKDTLGKAGAGACEARNDLRLSDTALDNLVTGKLASNETTFTATFPDFATWPADAQLAAMSMSWAVGPGGFPVNWPKLTTSLRAKDFAAAATECRLSETGNAGVAPRNVANVALLNNAAAVIANHADPATLYYPGTVPAAGPPPSGTPANSDPPANSDTPANSDPPTSSDTPAGADGSDGSSSDGSSSDGSSSDGSSDTTSSGDTSSDAASGDATSGSGDASTDGSDDTSSNGSEDSSADNSSGDSTDSSSGDPIDTSSDGSTDASSTDPSDPASGDATEGSGDASTGPSGDTGSKPDASSDPAGDPGDGNSEDSAGEIPAG